MIDASRILRSDRRPTGARGTDGFTLVELLVSATLFMGVAFVLYAFVRGGVSMWRIGERRQDLHERAELALERIADDLWCTFRPQTFEEAAPVSMFLADRPDAPKKASTSLREEQQKKPSVLGSRLRFVRTLRGEFQEPNTRYSGLEPKASAHYSFKNEVDVDGKPVAQSFRAAGGLMEVAYLATVRDRETGTGVLLRGARTPVGGAGSFFDDKRFEQSFPSAAEPIVTGVLHFGLEFWDQHAESWAQLADEEREPSVWDSTRGLIREFRYYKKGSFESDIDDMYPKRVRITLILARPNDPTMTAKLRLGVSRHDKKITFDRPGGLALEPESFVLIGGTEIVQITKTGSTRAKIVGNRGQFGTPEMDHDRGTPVVWGQMFTRVVNVPSYQENWNR